MGVLHLSKWPSMSSGTLSEEITVNMMTSSNGNIFRVTGHLRGEFTGHRWIPRTKASDAKLWCFLLSALNKHLSKQWRGGWFKTPSRPLWRHYNDRLLNNNVIIMLKRCFFLAITLLLCNMFAKNRSKVIRRHWFEITPIMFSDI